MIATVSVVIERATRWVFVAVKRTLENSPADACVIHSDLKPPANNPREDHP